MTFIEHDAMIQAFSPKAADNPLHIAALPRTTGSDWQILHTKTNHTLSKMMAIDTVAIPDQKAGRWIQGKASTSCCAVQTAVGCSITLKCTRTTNINNTRKLTVGTVKKSIETVSRRCCLRNVDHDTDLGLSIFGRYFSTVDLATSIPKR